MSRLAKLRGEHAHLSVLVRRLDGLVAAEEPPFAQGLDTVRRDLQATLIAHLQAEDWLLYPELLDCNDLAIAELAARFSAEMGGLAREFMAYSERWLFRPPTQDWQAFRIDTHAITAALSERIEREDRDLYPLLERLDEAA